VVSFENSSELTYRGVLQGARTLLGGYVSGVALCPEDLMNLNEATIRRIVREELALHERRLEVPDSMTRFSTFSPGHVTPAPLPRDDADIKMPDPGTYQTSNGMVVATNTDGEVFVWPSDDTTESINDILTRLQGSGFVES